jgi:hypothetical protein
MKLTTHLHLVLRSKNVWSYTSTPQYAFMAWCSLKKAQGQHYLFYLYLLWNSFQCHHHIFFMTSISWNHPLKASFIFRNSQKLLEAKSGKEGGCSISVINFCARNCLTESALWAGAVWWLRIQLLGQSSGLSLYTASCNCYNIST